MTGYKDFPKDFPEVGQTVRVVREKKTYPLWITEGMVLSRAIIGDSIYVSLFDSAWSHLIFKDGMWSICVDNQVDHVTVTLIK